MDGSHFPPPVCRATDPVFAHRPVMLDETLTGLNAAARGGIYVDGTFGRGGHAAAILDALAGRGVLHAFDQDPAAAASAARFAVRPDFCFHAANFEALAAVCAAQGIAGRVDGILLDLGVSSPQLDDATRGFSFSHDGPLDMRMNPAAGPSAAQWLASAKEDEIADVLFALGEERNSRRIARRIVEARAETPLTGTAQLAALIANVPGPRSHRIHPATRSFQAIRIHINRELTVLHRVLEQARAVLAPGGRLAVISFHSLEDRIVKEFLREPGNPRREAKNKYAQFSKAAPDAAPAGQPPALVERHRYLPTDAECAANPRARSAVLRVAEKTGAVHG